MLTAGSFGALTNTSGSYRLIGQILRSPRAVTTRGLVRTMSTSGNQLAPITGVCPKIENNCSQNGGRLYFSPAGSELSCTCGMVRHVSKQLMETGSYYQELKDKVQASTPWTAAYQTGSTATSPVSGSRPSPVCLRPSRQLKYNLLSSLNLFWICFLLYPNLVESLKER